MANKNAKSTKKTATTKTAKAAAKKPAAKTETKQPVKGATMNGKALAQAINKPLGELRKKNEKDGERGIWSRVRFRKALSDGTLRFRIAMGRNTENWDDMDSVMSKLGWKGGEHIAIGKRFAGWEYTKNGTTAQFFQKVG